MRPQIDIEALANDIKAGDRTALSRAITLVESKRLQDRSTARELMTRFQTVDTLLSSTRIGITGSPGAGKSTFIEVFGTSLTSAGNQVAVLAIDPSSTRTRGSILGDKTRMENLSRDPLAFVRPSPAGTTLGGVARATREAILLCEAAGYKHILIETVGVGQSEHAVRDLCDFMALLVLPGGGDDLQGIKRGIVELTDLVIVNKADGDRVPLARETASHYNRALHLQPARVSGWSPTAIQVSSTSGEGVAGFSESLRLFLETIGEAGILNQRRAQALRYFDRSWGESAMELFASDPIIKSLLVDFRQNILAGSYSAEQANTTLLDHLSKRMLL